MTTAATAPAVRFVLVSPRLLVSGMRLLRAQIGDPESPLPSALPVLVVSVECVDDCVRATVNERGRAGVFTRRMVWNMGIVPDAMALVVVEEE